MTMDDLIPNFFQLVVRIFLFCKVGIHDDNGKKGMICKEVALGSVLSSAFPMGNVGNGKYDQVKLKKMDRPWETKWEISH